MWRCCLVAVAACGFKVSGGVGGDAGPGKDAPADPDAPDPPVNPDGQGPDGAIDGGIDAGIDAPMVTACTVAPAQAAVAIGTVGGTGGNQSGTLVCPAGELPIGMKFDVTPAAIAAHANQLLMVNIAVRCGRVERLTSNVMQTTALGYVTHTGLMGSTPTACNAYLPPVASSEALCASGSVLVGVLGNQVDTTLYNTVAIVCAPVSTTGVVTTTTTTINVGGTGSYTNQPEMALCAAGRAITTLLAKSGCGQDGVTPSCAPLTCP